MKSRLFLSVALTLFAAVQCLAQCENGMCPAYPTQVAPNAIDLRIPCNVIRLEITKLEDTSIDLTAAPVVEAANAEDRFTRLVKATVRCTVSGVCGSGTVVGRDGSGNALVLTNAHVAGTQRGRVINLQRWNVDGTSERGTGAIIAAGYARGLSVDYALLRCNPEFAKDVQPIPLADRLPDQSTGVTTYGCPRCEWPSMQVLRMTRNTGQILRWQPEAIGGRSGSSLVDFTDAGPRVVGLLTWGGGGEGLGQSTPFLLNAMRGALPKSFESVPAYAQELAASEQYATDCIWPTPCLVDGSPYPKPMLLAMAQESEVDGKTDSTTIDSIIEQGPDNPPEEDRGLLRRPRDRDPGPDAPSDDEARRQRPGIFARVRGWLVTIGLMAVAGIVGYVAGRMRK